MANWIRVIAIGLIFVLSLFNLRLALQSVDSSSKRGGLYIGLIIVISVAILSLFQSLFRQVLNWSARRSRSPRLIPLLRLKQILVLAATQHFLSDTLPRRMSMS